jgi:hypothetical protein
VEQVFKSLYFSYIKKPLCSSLGHLSADCGIGFYKVVGELLIRTLDRDHIFPEVGGQVATDLRDGIKGGFGWRSQGKVGVLT